MAKTKTVTPEPPELIPSNREMSTAARMRLVADILEKNPERHDQETWNSFDFNDVDEYTPDDEVIEAVSEHRTCGSTGCAAGWAVAATPPAVIRKALDKMELYNAGQLHWSDTKDEWQSAGAAALGLDYDLARMLFDSDNTRSRLIKALRRLADLPPKQRTLEAAEGMGITSLWLAGHGRARLKGDK